MKHSLIFLTLLTIQCAFGIVADAVSEGEEDNVLVPPNNNISRVLRASGEIGGRIIIWESMNDHSREMREIIKRKGVSLENIVISGTYSFDLDLFHDADTYVVNSSTTWGQNPSNWEIESIQGSNTLFVCAAGNVRQWGIPTRDLYQPDNPAWKWQTDFRNYDAAMRLLETGKVIVATAVIEVSHWEDGRVVEREYHISQGTVRCDDAKEYCFSVPFNHVGEEIHTSGAAARLSALSFYLRQLWDTPEEVIDVLRKTATDIGNPGVDEEFGWGVPTMNHPIVRRKATEKVAQHLLFLVSENLLLAEAQEGNDVLAKHRSPFTPSYKVGEGSQGVCVTYNRKKNRLMLGFGSDVSPFGVTSPLFGQQQKPVVQLGVRRLLLELDGDHNLSVFAQYGQSTGEDYAVRNGRIGLNYQTQLGTTAHLSLYAGYRQVWGSVGIPGYEAAGVGQTPFVKHLSEVRTSFNWSF